MNGWSKLAIMLEVIVLVKTLIWDRKTRKKARGFERGPNDLLCRTAKRTIAIFTIFMLLLCFFEVAVTSEHIMYDSDTVVILKCVIMMVAVFYYAFEVDRADKRLKGITYSQIRKRRETLENEIKAIRTDTAFWRRAPLAAFTRSMYRIRDDATFDDDLEASTFIALWPVVKEHLRTLNKPKLDEIVVKDRQEDLSDDFYDLLTLIDYPLEHAGYYEELIRYCDDMLELFTLSDEQSESFLATKGRMMRLAGEDVSTYFGDLLMKRDSEDIAAAYAHILISDKEYARAADVLRKYADRGSSIIQDEIKRFRRKALVAYWRNRA